MEKFIEVVYKIKYLVDKAKQKIKDGYVINTNGHYPYKIPNENVVNILKSILIIAEDVDTGNKALDVFVKEVILNMGYLNRTILYYNHNTHITTYNSSGYYSLLHKTHIDIIELGSFWYACALSDAHHELQFHFPLLSVARIPFDKPQGYDLVRTCTCHNYIAYYVNALSISEEYFNKSNQDLDIKRLKQELKTTKNEHNQQIYSLHQELSASQLKYKSLTKNMITLTSNQSKIYEQITILKQELSDMTAKYEQVQQEMEILKAKVLTVVSDPIVYDYEDIKSRIAPFRDELIIVQRTFMRILKAQHALPIAMIAKV